MADGVPDGDGSDVDDEKLFRCHGPCGTSVGTEVGSSSIVDANADKGWVDGVWLGSLMLRFARSATVSVAVQNMGGLFFQPIGSTIGNATKRGWPGRVGNTTPNLGMSLGAKARR